MDYERSVAERHLRWLFGRYKTGWCELRGLSDGRQPRRLSVEIEVLMGPGIDHLHAEVERWVRDRYDVYVGVLPRSRKHMVAGKAGVDAILAAGVFWIDLDRKIDGVRLELLDKCPLVIDTGNGWHGYQPMPYPIDVTPATRRMVPQLVRVWQNEILAGTDNVSDLPRIMRLAGSVNHKGDPKPVTIVRLETPKPKPVARPAVKPRSEIGRPNPPDWTEEEEQAYRAMHRLDAVVDAKDAIKEASMPWPIDYTEANRREWAERIILRMIARGDAIGAVIDFASAEGIPHGRVGELIEWMEGIE